MSELDFDRLGIPRDLRIDPEKVSGETTLEELVALYKGKRWCCVLACCVSRI